MQTVWAIRQRAPLAMTFVIPSLGLCGGVLVGLLGIGGGVFWCRRCLFADMDQHLAQGTSLFILLHYRAGALRRVPEARARVTCMADSVRSRMPNSAVMR